MSPVEGLNAAAAKLREPDQQHVAPELAKPLAAWLEVAAHQAAMTAHPAWQPIVAAHALSVARPILGVA
jgi:hypothetical protein